MRAVEGDEESGKSLGRGRIGPSRDAGAPSRAGGKKRLTRYMVAICEQRASEHQRRCLYFDPAQRARLAWGMKPAACFEIMSLRPSIMASAASGSSSGFGFLAEAAEPSWGAGSLRREPSV